MIPGLEEVDAVVSHDVNNPVLEAEPSRPDVRPEVLEGLWLAESRKRVTHNVQDNFENPDGVFPVYSDPVLEVFEKLRIEDRFTAF